MLKQIAMRVTPHPVYRLWRSWRVAQLVRAFDSYEVQETFGGHVLRLLITDPLAKGWYTEPWPELSEVRELRSIGALRAGSTVFDLGAHQGVVALMLGREVGATGRVIAIEAEPHNARVASRNVELNDARNVTVVHAAASDVIGSTNFAVGLNGSVDSDTRIGNVEVTSVTVDCLAARYGAPDVVFVDVEGYEGLVLAGAREVLASRDAAFVIEVHVGDLVGCDAADILAAFDGYDVRVADGDGANGAGAFRPAAGGLPEQRFVLLAAPRR